MGSHATSGVEKGLASSVTRQPIEVMGFLHGHADPAEPTTFLVTDAGGQMRQANLANGFTVEWEYTEEFRAPVSVAVGYTGVNVGGLLNDRIYMEITETR